MNFPIGDVVSWISQQLFWQAVPRARFKEDKGVLELDGKPLLNYVVDAVKGLVDEVIVVTSSQERADAYSKMVSSKVRFAVDVRRVEGTFGWRLNWF